MASELNTGRWVDDHLAKLNPHSEWQPDVARALARVNEQRGRRAANGRKWSSRVAIVLAGCVGLLAFPAPRGIAQRCVGACESFFLKSAGKARVPATIEPGTAPDFSVKDARGTDLRLSAYQGKVVLLNFWATWCAPCKAEIPWFVEFERAYGNRGFAVIGISMDEDGWKAVNPYIELQQINYRIAIGNQALAEQYGGVDALPETLLIDRTGRIAAKHVGIVKKGDYESEIIRLLGK